MVNWLDIFKHVLPRARAWRLTVDKTLRQFFDGLSATNDGYKTFYDEIWQDLDPQLTRELDLWESQFGLRRVGLSESERRDRLAATWAALGGQSPRYIQDTLQAAGFPVYVHEWWVPGSSPVTARDPNDYLDDGTAAPFTMYDGGADSQDGDALSQDGGTTVPVGYPLVNKILEGSPVIISDGSAEMQDGGALAQDGGSLVIYRYKQYTIPSDSTKFPYFLYIGGGTFPDVAIIPQSRQDEFEELCLKICPTEQWLGMLVTYT